MCFFSRLQTQTQTGAEKLDRRELVRVLCAHNCLLWVVKLPDPGIQSHVNHFFFPSFFFHRTENETKNKLGHKNLEVEACGDLWAHVSRVALVSSQQRCVATKNSGPV